MKQRDNYRVAIYCRLSKDDYNEGESSSITSQKSMLTAYVQEKGWDIVGYYVEACDIIEPTQRNQSYQGFQRFGSFLLLQAGA